MPGGVGQRSGNGANRLSPSPIVLLQSGKLFGRFERESHMVKRQKRWIYSPRKPVPPRIPEDMQMEVTKKANELIDTLLKPNYLQPPPETPQFNYIIDIFGKWYRSYFYFCSTYCCPGPNAISPTFEVRFTRLHYAGNGRFNLAHMIPTCAPCDILGETMKEGKKPIVGTRVTRAAAHYPVEEVKRRMKLDPRSWVRERWGIIYLALMRPRKAEEIARDMGGVSDDSAPRHF
jgi:hypothetical protein